MIVELFQVNVKYDVIPSSSISQKRWNFIGSQKEYEEETELIFDFIGDPSISSRRGARNNVVEGTEVSLQE
jgi:hypothetical protein